MVSKACYTAERSLGLGNALVITTENSARQIAADMQVRHPEGKAPGISTSISVSTRSTILYCSAKNLDCTDASAPDDRLPEGCMHMAVAVDVVDTNKPRSCIQIRPAVQDDSEKAPPVTTTLGRLLDPLA
ncbi:uncharacterized protein N7459_001316 [Penicillium hispanicum]|uniref:uncharacterized protein n=1 Tax=Penicillium hispanicum TaxID=1080232 RepID=UPI00254261B7|nr:uncharacterized protein N7459_001316 [Penicillium hispanicum]KAJ5595108.1 hypothetical protein N7459_001316 [Penicillium hispanicum]